MSKTVKSFEELNVWQNSKDIVNMIYQFTKKESFRKDYSLCDQIRRASVSIMSNIAEGFERGSNKEFIQFLYIAKGSCAEVRSLLYVALELQHITAEDFLKTKDECMKLSSMISNLIKYLVSKNMKRQRRGNVE